MEIIQSYGAMIGIGIGIFFILLAIVLSIIMKR